MGNHLACWSFLFHILLLLCAHGNGSRMKIENNRDGHMQHHMSAGQAFFRLKDLRIGNAITTHFQKMGSSKPPPLLTREKAESIPFSVKDLPYILRYFSFSPGSPQAKAMQETLQSCEGETMEGETRICATSLESMLDFVSESFGHKSRFHALTTRHKTDPKWEFVQNYTIIQAPKEVSSSRIVACHPLSYPYSVYLCHYQHGNKVLKVSLADENGDQIEAVATCHMDTSKWYPGHISFAILGTRPGSAEACHFFPVYHVAWVPADS